MATFKCKMCGGALEVNEQMTVCECEYCGTQQTLPKINDEQKIGMFNRANHFRQQCEFDKAAEIYEKLAAESGNDAELFWSLVLCRYGIEYVDDPVTKNKIPTCHRTQYKSILDDPDYHTALEYADSIQRKVYEQEALRIFNIQKGIIEISNKEKPYDVFICYKETDENGRRTPDSVLAQDLYYGLTQEGFKVFFSRITLESKLGAEYEPYIFAALNSSKVMVVVGTKPEYFNAVWVRNEWSRYLQLMQEDKSKIIIPAYKDMDPYDLPDSLSLFQSQDMSKLGFLQDLIRGIKKVTNNDDEQNNDRYVDQPAPVERFNTNAPFSQASADTEKKKPTLVYALIGLVLFLCVGIGILGGVLFSKNNNGNSDKPPTSIADVVSTAVSTNNITETTATVTSPTSTTTAEKEIATTAPAVKPTAKAYIEEISGFPRGNGSSFVLHVNGDFSYYYYEGYYTGGGSTDQMCINGTSSEPSVELTAGSVMSQVRAVVTPYNEDGLAGDSISISIKPEYSSNQWNAARVISCKFYGEINAPGGGPINGYTTSYLINGGAYSCERVDLMDKWHVTAVNYYSANNDIWYELYDTDDGDYYGWVNQKNFTFY